MMPINYRAVYEIVICCGGAIMTCVGISSFYCGQGKPWVLMLGVIQLACALVLVGGRVYKHYESKYKRKLYNKRLKHNLCTYCGYNLKGIPRVRCPECGHAIEGKEMHDLL